VAKEAWKIWSFISCTYIRTNNGVHSNRQLGPEKYHTRPASKQDAITTTTKRSPNKTTAAKQQTAITSTSYKTHSLQCKKQQHLITIKNIESQILKQTTTTTTTKINSQGQIFSNT